MEIQAPTVQISEASQKTQLNKVLLRCSCSLLYQTPPCDPLRTWECGAASTSASSRQRMWCRPPLPQSSLCVEQQEKMSPQPAPQENARALGSQQTQNHKERYSSPFILIDAAVKNIRYQYFESFICHYCQMLK